MEKRKKILVAPLNWGLGHATRCLPIIEELRRQGAVVVVASDGIALEWLRKELPADIEIHALPPYNIRYPFENMLVSMALQMLKILRGAIREHFWLRDFLKKNAVDAVISDNRFGFFSRRTYSIFLTHQVNIQMPIRFLEPFVNAVNQFFIRRFDVCWIPDAADSTVNLSGKLAHVSSITNVTNANASDGVTRSHPVTKQISLEINYLGALSRMKNFPSKKKYCLAVVLSGPEPQRTILEKIILKQIVEVATSRKPKAASREPQAESGEQQAANDTFLFVRGTNQPFEFSTAEHLLKHNIELHNLLTTNDLNRKMLESEVVICRSGYSTIMDLAVLKLPAVLIPTPGQTEQEYLAERLAADRRFVHQTQSTFDLAAALRAVPTMRGFADLPTDDGETLRQIIRELLEF